MFLKTQEVITFETSGMKTLYDYALYNLIFQTIRNYSELVNTLQALGVPIEVLELYSDLFYMALQNVLGKVTYLQLLTGFFISQYQRQLSAQTPKVHVNQHMCSL